MNSSIFLAVLVAFALMRSGVGQQCVITQPSERVAQLPTGDNNFYLGGLFPVHEWVANGYKCGELDVNAMMNMEAFFWALNRDRDSEANIKVGGIAFDTCSRAGKAVESVLSFEYCKAADINVSPTDVLGYIGPTDSNAAIDTALNLKGLNKTQISPAAKSEILEDDDMFPYFTRTVPNDGLDVKILVDILAAKEWKYVIALHEDNQHAKASMEQFRKFASEAGICIVLDERLPASGDQEHDALVDRMVERSDARFVVIIAKAAATKRVLNAVARDNSNGVFTFLATTLWGKKGTFLEPDTVATVNGAITVSLEPLNQYAILADRFFSDFVQMKPADASHNPWFGEFWENVFDCNLAGSDRNLPGRDDCDPSAQSLVNRVQQDEYLPYTIMATQAMISGIKAAAMKECQNQYEMCSAFMNSNVRGPDIWRWVGSSLTKEGVRVFEDDGKLAVNSRRYAVHNIQNGRYEDVGTYRGNTLDLVNNFRIFGVASELNFPISRCYESPCLVCGEAASTAPPVGSPNTQPAVQTTPYDPTEGGKYAFIKILADASLPGTLGTPMSAASRMDTSSSLNRTVDITRYSEGQKWIIPLGVLAGLGVLAVIIFEIYIISRLMGRDMSTQLRTMWLGQLLLFGIFCSYLTLFAYLFIPTNTTCGITRFGVGMSYAICFAVLLVKLMVLLTSYSRNNDGMMGAETEQPRYLRGIYQFLMFLLAVGVQLVISIQWMLTIPPVAVQVINHAGKQVWICSHYTWVAASGNTVMSDFSYSTFENHLLSLIYIMFLILLTTIVSMSAHGITTNHRESIFIGISSGFSIPLWIAWGLVGGLNRDNAFAEEYGDAAMAFGLFLVATLILFAMFLPKVRQLVSLGLEGIYLEDDRSTYYAPSVAIAPSGYKMKPSGGSVVYVNNGYTDPIIRTNGDDSSLVLRHPGSSYNPQYNKSRYGPGAVVRLTGDLTGYGKQPHHPRSETGYASSKRSEKGTLKRARSAQDLGAL